MQDTEKSVLLIQILYEKIAAPIKIYPIKNRFNGVCANMLSEEHGR